MNFWWFMLACDLLIPATMLAVGCLLRRYPPKKFNELYGYRTARAKQSPEAWQFAQSYCGRSLQRLGGLLLLPSLAAHLPFYHSSDNVIGSLSIALCTIQCTALFLPIYLTERALKKSFTPADQ